MKPLFIQVISIVAGAVAGLQAANNPASDVEAKGRSEARAEGNATATSGSALSGGTESPGPASGAPGATTTNVHSSATTHTSADGTAITTLTTERDGKKTTRTIVIGKDGSVVVSDPSQGRGGSGPAVPGTPGSMAASAAPVPSSGWLGVHSVAVSEVLRSHVELPEGQGVVLEFVADDGPAAAAGLRTNDIVLSLDGEPVADVSAFRARLALTHPGQLVSVGYLRKGKPSTATVTLGERPADAAPGPPVAGEAGRVIQESSDKAHLVRRGVVVDGAGKTHVIENGDPFDLLLNDPNVPEEMKAHLRESRELIKRTLPADAPEAPKNQ